MIHLLVAFRLTTAGEEAGSPPLSDPVALEQPRWIRYRVGRGEQPIDVAARFGVSVAELSDWNDLGSGPARLKVGRRLKVHARRDPPARERRVHVVERGQTWQDIAIQHRVDSRLLRAYNWQRKRLAAGDRVLVWVDPGQPHTLGGSGLGTAPEGPAVSSGGESVGRPQAGRLRGGVPLPESPLYTRVRAAWAYGSTHALTHLRAAILEFRRRDGYAGPVMIGSISRRRGGSFPPHHSHQSGRDVDIRLPVRPGADLDRPPRAHEVDWPAAWSLVDALIDTGEVQLILLEDDLQRRLWEAARWAGESPERLADTIHWADPRRYSRAVVRHADGHDGHVHVRFRCGADERRCRG